MVGQKSLQHMLIATLLITATHLVLRRRHRAIVRQNCNLPTLEDGEEDSP